MQKRHFNREQYFKEQGITTKKHVIPFVQEVFEINKNSEVLEIGCGEGGNLFPFVEMGCKRVVGIDMLQHKINNAKKFFLQEEKFENVEFICEDIYNIKVEDVGQFDFIFLRDVLEHIHGQEKFMNFVKRFLKPTGRMFFGFPPWHNPFGGHQQVCDNKFLSKVPYFHILPVCIYSGILKMFGESNRRIYDLLEIKETRITIERFERILKKEKLKKYKRTLYFINPNYEIKFGLKPRKIWKPIEIIPFFRGFFITTNYYVIGFDDKKHK